MTEAEIVQDIIRAKEWMAANTHLTSGADYVFRVPVARYLLALVKVAVVPVSPR